MRYTLDVPVPYRIADLLALLDTRMGKLENRSSRMVYHKLITRIETVYSDPRYGFMFENANIGGDTMVEILASLFRLPPQGVPMTILQLAGFPSEVVDAVVSVTCRMAFDLGLWSDGANPLLVVCEEAHRYMSADHSIGFAPTRRAISRIAKEGRKYGVFLGLVTQRPAELNSTILSQCSTLFAMRMTNDRDQTLLRSAVADTAANFLAFLPSLGTGEAFAFGEGVALPTRIKFRQLAGAMLPKSETVTLATSMPQPDATIVRWRPSSNVARPHRKAAFRLRPAGRRNAAAAAGAGRCAAGARSARPQPLQAPQAPARAGSDRSGSALKHLFRRGRTDRRVGLHGRPRQHQKHQEQRADETRHRGGVEDAADLVAETDRGIPVRTGPKNCPTRPMPIAQPMPVERIAVGYIPAATAIGRSRCPTKNPARKDAARASPSMKSPARTRQDTARR